MALTADPTHDCTGSGMNDPYTCKVAIAAFAKLQLTAIYDGVSGCWFTPNAALSNGGFQRNNAIPNGQSSGSSRCGPSNSQIDPTLGDILYNNAPSPYCSGNNRVCLYGRFSEVEIPGFGGFSAGTGYAVRP